MTENVHSLAIIVGEVVAVAIIAFTEYLYDLKLHE